MNAHSFDPRAAAKYGLDAAVFLQNLCYWIQKNRANQKHFHEGRTWTYNSKKAFAEIFIYWNERQIRYIIERLEKEGVIITGEFNRDKRDRTTWFALRDENRWLGAPNSSVPNLENASAKIGMPSAESGSSKTCQNWQLTETVNKPDNKQTKETSSESAASPHSEFIEQWSEAYAMQKGEAYAFNGGRDAKAVKELLQKSKMTPGQLVAIATKAWGKDGRDFWNCANQSGTISKFSAHFNEIREELSRAAKPAGAPANTPQQPPQTIFNLQAMVKAKEQLASEIEKKTSHDAFGPIWASDPVKHKQWKQLKAEVRQLREKLGGLADSFLTPEPPPANNAENFPAHDAAGN